MRRFLAGIGPGTLRSGPRAGPHFGRRNQLVECAGERPARCPQRAEEQERRGPAHPHRDGDFAHPGEPAWRHPEGVSGVQVVPVGAGRTAQRARRGQPGVRPAHQHLLQSGQRQHDCFAGFGFSGLGRGQPALRAAVCGAAPGARKPDRHEPAVRGGTNAYAHGGQGRSPPAAARRRHRSIRRSAGHGAGCGQRAGQRREPRRL